MRLKREKSLELIKFISEGEYDISLDLDEAVDRILRNKSALSL